MLCQAGHSKLMKSIVQIMHITRKLLNSHHLLEFCNRGRMLQLFLQYWSERGFTSDDDMDSVAARDDDMDSVAARDDDMDSVAARDDDMDSVAARDAERAATDTRDCAVAVVWLVFQFYFQMVTLILELAFSLIKATVSLIKATVKVKVSVV